MPDWLCIWCGENIFIELKSRRGVASRVQKQIRDELLAAGVKFWWLARTLGLFFSPCSARACLSLNGGRRRRSSLGKGLLKIRMHGCRNIPRWRVSAPQHNSATASVGAREKPQCWRRSAATQGASPHQPPTSEATP
jgi:hypothetical protein